MVVGLAIRFRHITKRFLFWPSVPVFLSGFYFITFQENNSRGPESRPFGVEYQTTVLDKYLEWAWPSVFLFSGFLLTFLALKIWKKKSLPRPLNPDS